MGFIISQGGHPGELNCTMVGFPDIRALSRGLSLAMADPSDTEAMEDLAHLVGCTIKPLAAPEIRLLQALQEYYRIALEPRDRRLLELSEYRESSLLTVPLEVVVEEGELEEAEIIEDDDFGDEPEPGMTNLALAFSEVRDRQEVAEIVLRQMNKEFDRAALFLVRDNEISGWRAFRRQEEVDGFERFSIPLGFPSVLKTVVEGKSFYLGPITSEGLNEELIRGLGGGKPEAVLLVPLILDGRVVNVLYGDGAPAGLVAQVGSLQRLQEMAGLAFRILILKHKLLQL